jgi:hypothetical protein
MNSRPLIASRRWTSEEDHRLRALAGDGRSAAVIAERLKRSQSAVYRRASKLSVVLKMIGLGLKAKK